MWHLCVNYCNKNQPTKIANRSTAERASSQPGFLITFLLQSSNSSVIGVLQSEIHGTPAVCKVALKDGL